MDLTNVETKHFPNGNRYYYCKMSELKDEFKEMVLKHVQRV